MYLLSSVACLYRSLRNEHIWFLYLNLKVVSQSPMYVSFVAACSVTKSDVCFFRGCIGLCDTTFKLRYRNHICSFHNERYKHATELSKYIWSLKDQKIAYQIKWRKIKQARSYSNVSKRCNLCLWEKFFILRRPEMSTLNSRNELTSGCRHARKFLLKNVLF